MAFPFFILTSSVWEFPLLYILISIQCCRDSRCGHLKLYLTVVLICHPLVTQDVVHLYKFIAILYTVFCFFLQFFIIPLFFFDLFPCDLINTFSGMLGFLSFACVCVCVSILIWGFGYYEDYIQQPIYLYMVKLIHS